MTNPESQEFEQLRRLLALKRHEEPPPGYFHHFSREVTVRIKAGETGETKARNWAERIWAMLETKPAFAGAFGASICAVLVSGLLNSEDSTESASDVLAPGFSHANAFAPSPAVASAESMTVAAPSLSAASDTASLERLFDFQPGRLQTTPVHTWSSNP